MAPGGIHLRSFASASAPEDYATYRRMKFRVFVAEQGWPLTDSRAPGLAAEDPFDARARLWLAETDTGEPMGVVRTLSVRYGFPHAELFERHLEHPVFARAVPYLGTINALAVLPEYRRRRFHVCGTAWVGKIGQLLLLASLRVLEQDGLRMAVATTGNSISTRLFSRVGFHVIDRPERTALHPDLMMTNVGIVLGAPEHLRAQQECGIEPMMSSLPAAAMEREMAYLAEQQFVSRKPVAVHAG
jgi:hypothetical protein